MKNLNKTITLTLSALVFTLSVSAHDPSMHVKKEAKKADCTAFNKMQEAGTKMDMNDPVMLAMMKKCKGQKAEAQGGHEKKGDMKCGDSMKKDMKKVKNENEHNH